jgi:hypothetical protein
MKNSGLGLLWLLVVVALLAALALMIKGTDNPAIVSKAPEPGDRPDKGAAQPVDTGTRYRNAFQGIKQKAEQAEQAGKDRLDQESGGY